MDDQLCRDFFAQPQGTQHRRYEALRAYFVDKRPLAEIADQFGYKLSALKSMTCRFRAARRDDRASPFFFQSRGDDPDSNVVPATSTVPTLPPLPINEG